MANDKTEPPKRRAAAPLLTTRQRDEEEARSCPSRRHESNLNFAPCEYAGGARGHRPYRPPRGPAPLLRAGPAVTSKWSVGDKTFQGTFCFRAGSDAREAMGGAAPERRGRPAAPSCCQAHPPLAESSATRGLFPSRIGAVPGRPYARLHEVVVVTVVLSPSIVMVEVVWHSRLPPPKTLPTFFFANSLMSSQMPPQEKATTLGSPTMVTESPSDSPAEVRIVLRPVVLMALILSPFGVVSTFETRMSARAGKSSNCSSSSLLRSHPHPVAIVFSLSSFHSARWVNEEHRGRIFRCSW